MSNSFIGKSPVPGGLHGVSLEPAVTPAVLPAEKKTAAPVFGPAAQRDRITPAIQHLRKAALAGKTRLTDANQLTHVDQSHVVLPHAIDAAVAVSVKNVQVTTQAELTQALQVCKNGNVDKLTLVGSVFTDDDLRTLPASLTQLDLSDCNRITDAGLAHLKKLPLQRLTLMRLNISNDGLAHLQAMPLQQLDLSGCEHITDTGVAHLAHHLLQQLDLSWCGRITDKGLAYLQKMPLQRLNLLRSNITDAGLAYLQAMPLQELHVSKGNQITDAGLRHLQDMPLQRLYLQGGAQITDAGLACLAKLPLESLHLTGCVRITSAGLAHLQAMPLHTLSLRGANSMKDEGLQYLWNLPLQQLNVSECPGLSEVGHAQLRQYIPDLQLQS